MKFTIAAVALFLSLAIAAPLKSAATRDLNESVDTMTSADGTIVPFDSKTVAKTGPQ